MSNISSKDYVSNLLKTVSGIASFSNAMPMGEDYAFVSLDSGISVVKAQIEDKVQSILTMLVQFVTPEAVNYEYEDIVEASDKCLEHVAITLDNLKNPNPIIPKISNYELPKPKLPLKSDNSYEPFSPILTHKPNSVVPLSQSPHHPYLPELDRLIYTPFQLSAGAPTAYLPIEETPLAYIDTLSKLQSMINDLNQYKEIAIDLEHHSFRSYQGFTCLIQISTRDKDYIIDPFPIWGSIELLLDVFTNPGIIKVLHGADSDVLWLQRDFGLYIVNMFDTGQAARKLMYSRYGLGFLLENICNIKTDKNFQMADWRVRPLSEDHIKYARMDTHYLLYIYDYLKLKLQTKANQLKLNPIESIKEVFNKSKEICMKNYAKIDLSFVGITGVELLDKKQRKILENLVKWRDQIARQEDENPNYILSGRKVMMIVYELPDNLKTLAKIVQNLNFIKKQGETILGVIKNNDIIDDQEDIIINSQLEVNQPNDHRPPYSQKFSVIVNKFHQISLFDNSNSESINNKYQHKLENITNSLNSIFDQSKSLYFNTPKLPIKEVIKKTEYLEEVPLSIKEKYHIPMKSKTPQTKKPKETLTKKQKITEKKDIKIGWLDNVELQPVKRKNLFKKKHY
jgi:ribonuclease D